MSSAPSVGHVYSDLLTRTHEYEISGLRVHAIDLPTLIEAKEIADRPKDRQALFFFTRRNSTQPRCHTGNTITGRVF